MHDAAQQQRTNPLGNLGVTIHNHLQVLCCVHALKLDAPPILLGVLERGIGGGSVVDEGGPDASEGGYWVTHDARGEELRLVVSGGETMWRAAGLVSELAEDGVGGFVVSDDAKCYQTEGGGGQTIETIPRPLANESIAPEVVQ